MNDTDLAETLADEKEDKEWTIIVAEFGKLESDTIRVTMLVHFD